MHPFIYKPLLALALLLTASSCARHQLYRTALAEQQQAEQALAERDTVQALQHLRHAYVHFVDSDHPERWRQTLTGIHLLEVSLRHGPYAIKSHNPVGELADSYDSMALIQQHADQSRKRLHVSLLLASGILLLLAGGAALLVSFQRHRRLEAENQLLQAKLQLDRQQSRLSTLQDSAATPALTLALRSYEQLCSRYEPDGDNAALLREFRQQMADLRNGTAFAADLETTLEAACPGLLQRIREIPGLREDERRLLRYLAAGFPTYLIAAATGRTRAAVNMQVSRLRGRIASADEQTQALLLPFFDARRPGRPRK
ncbi:MAG: hypothetical protein Q4E27_06380 [Bacteroidales bacterium]|nr:hypothetical protein [Bacteroidales bacterium]